MTPEGKIKKEIREYLEALGWLVINVTQFNKKGYKVHKGVSDLIVLKNGQTIYIETKTPTGEQLPSQIKFERDVREHGGRYIIARSVEDVQILETPF